MDEKATPLLAEPDYASDLERRFAQAAPSLFPEWSKTLLYQPVTFRLARRTSYTPDFMMVTSRVVEFYEIKGSWKAPHQEDARAKLKIAAKMFPWFRFWAATPKKKRDGGGWDFEEIKP